MKKAVTLKGCLSLWICFQLSVVILSPMTGTMMTPGLSNLVEPYAQLMGFSATWNFFSPEPGPASTFIEWAAEGSEGELVEEGKWPGALDPYIFRDRQNRRLSALLFMLSGDSRAENMLVPFLCRKNPKIKAVSLSRVSYSIPSLEEMQQIRQKEAESVPVTQTERVDRRWVSHTFCSEVPHQIALAGG